MSDKTSFYTLDSLVRILLGTAVSAVVAFLMGPGRFALRPGNGSFFFLVFGFECSVIYAIYKSRGKAIAIGTAFLGGLIVAALFTRYFVDTLIFGIAAPVVLILFCGTPVRWNITKPQFGRYIVLAPVFTLLGLVVTSIGALASQTAYFAVFVRNGTLQAFGLGLGLGVGLEAAEHLITYWHNRTPTAA